jgi:hypothetical protein
MHADYLRERGKIPESLANGSRPPPYILPHGS